MSDLPEDLFANPVWHALHTRHRHFAESAGDACRYPADVAPFAAVDTPTTSALQSLHSLLVPGEYVWLIGESYPSIADLPCAGTIECLQMVLPEAVTPPDPNPVIVPLSCTHASEMVALTDIAFPGFFRLRTCVMGSYFGIWNPTDPTHLIAMAGERLVLHPHREVSGVCTHPNHRGQGYAAALTAHVLHHQRSLPARSVLHVVSTNHAAISIYHRLGFQTLREVHLHRLKRPD